MEFKYEQDALRIIHQIPAITTVMPDYKEKYNSLGILTEAMSYLRLGLITRFYKGPRTHLLDIGPGNGHFVRLCKTVFVNAQGYDKGDDSVLLKLRYNVVTMFDSLEHIEDLSFIKHLNTDMVIVSVPWCHWLATEDEFLSWKHRRPGEHLHHFGQYGLNQLFFAAGFVVLWYGNVEDAIRRNPDQSQENILTMIFKKRT